MPCLWPISHHLFLPEDRGVFICEVLRSFDVSEWPRPRKRGPRANEHPEVPLDEFEDDHRRVVALARAEFENAGITAISPFVAGGYLGE